MRLGIAIGLLLVLVPLQVTLLDRVSLAGIRPDLCLIAGGVIGFWFGPTNGVLTGLMLGFGQDLFSAGELWVNMGVKGTVGFFSGILARNLANTGAGSIFLPMVGFSLFSGIIGLVSSRAGLLIPEFLAGLPSIILPQALLDGLVGIGANWLIRKWLPPDMLDLS